MSLCYNIADALRDCAHRKRTASASAAPSTPMTAAQMFLPVKTNKLKELDIVLYEELWQSLLKWIVTDFDRGRGINIPFLMKITWRSEINVEENCRVLRPIFLPADSFLRSHNLLVKHRLKPEEVNGLTLGKAEEINFAKIAIRYSQHLSKDMVFMGTRKVFNRIGQAMAQGKNVKIDFGVGELTCYERKIDFVFNPEFQRRTLVEDESGRVSALEGLAESVSRDLSQTEKNRPPSRPGSRASIGVSTSELPLTRLNTSGQRSEMAIEQAYQRYAQGLNEREREARRIEEEEMEILHKLEQEERMKQEERKKKLTSQAEYIRREIARKEEERKKAKYEERTATTMVLEVSRPGSIMAFPVEPDPLPLSNARKKEQAALRNFLLQQVEAKKREKQEQRIKDAKETRAHLLQVEAELMSDAMEKALKQEADLTELRKHRLKQISLKQRTQNSPSPTKQLMQGGSRPPSVGMRTFEIMTPAQINGGLGTTPYFSR